jgi:hypothetical protein
VQPACQPPWVRSDFRVWGATPCGHCIVCQDSSVTSEVLWLLPLLWVQPGCQPPWVRYHGCNLCIWVQGWVCDGPYCWINSLYKSQCLKLHELRMLPGGVCSIQCTCSNTFVTIQKYLLAMRTCESSHQCHLSTREPNAHCINHNVLDARGDRQDLHRVAIVP